MAIKQQSTFQFGAADYADAASIKQSHEESLKLREQQIGRQHLHDLEPNAEKQCGIDWADDPTKGNYCRAKLIK